MGDVRRIYDALADLLAYPGPAFQQRLADCREALGRQAPEALHYFNRFAERSGSLLTEELEELYTHTFDLNPVCSLEIGWHLFGENYSRGEFLVTMRQAMRELGLEESTELPDHLVHVLQVACRMQPGQADRFTTRYLLPALEKMQAGLADKANPYQDLLETIRSVLISPYGAVTGELTHG
jgi:nitrate reductase delta subunit